MIPKCKNRFFASLLAVLALALAGCGGRGGSLPEEEPETVTKRFYELISSAKTDAGAATASEAFKLVDTRTSNMNVTQFLEIIKRYPEKFTVTVGKAEIKGTQALVSISYKLPSSFGGDFTVEEVVPLNIDPAKNTWVIDFTGDSYGMQKDEAIAASKAQGPPPLKDQKP